MATWERARDEAQKQERRESILAAARQLLDTQGPDGVSLNAIGRAADLSKSNLYRYFESREAILARVFLDDHSMWVRNVERALAPLSGQGTARAIAEAVIGEAIAMPRLGMLGAILASVLERNICEQAVVDIKLELSDAGLRFGNALVAAAPRLPATKARILVDAFYALAAGIWPAFAPSPAVQAALTHPEVRHMAFDLDRSFITPFSLMLTGALCDAERAEAERAKEGVRQRRSKR